MPILETAIILPVVMGIDLQIQSTQSTLSIDFDTAISNTGNLTGSHDPESNPDGTITIPGLWGGSGTRRSRSTSTREPPSTVRAIPQDPCRWSFSRTRNWRSSMVSP